MNLLLRLAEPLSSLELLEPGHLLLSAVTPGEDGVTFEAPIHAASTHPCLGVHPWTSPVVSAEIARQLSAVVTYAALGVSEAEEYAANTLDVVFPRSRLRRGRGHEHPALPEPRPLVARCAVRAFEPLGGGVTRARLEVTLENDDGSRTTVALSGRVLSREVLERARAAQEASPPATPELAPVVRPPADPAEPADVEAAPGSVLVSTPARDGDALTFTFFTQAAPLWLADVGLDHVPAVLLIEAATQALFSAARADRAARPGAPAPPRIAYVERLEARLFRFLRRDAPATLRVQLRAPEEPGSPLRAVRATIEVAQHGHPAATLTLGAALTDPS